VFLVRKLGTPGHTELAMGAIASGSTRVINEDVVQALGIDREQIDVVARREPIGTGTPRRRVSTRAVVDALAERTVILVDDGLATGSTMKAAVQAVRQHAPLAGHRCRACRRSRDLPRAS
jgi:predicted phosphoribosyltransferase